RLDGGQKCCSHPVIRARRALGRFCGLGPQSGDDDGLILHVLENFRDVREILGKRTFLLRLPVSRGHTMWIKDANESRLRRTSRGRLRQERSSGNHGFQQRQSESDSSTTEERTTRYCFLG